mmetsp:Transcript_9768/g.36250  ORF Transcript_9768/g.36250 Transcript_9768/m.36250 type:complete len:307 (+) Transcript_9768:726-1646(+)
MPRERTTAVRHMGRPLRRLRDRDETQPARVSGLRVPGNHRVRKNVRIARHASNNVREHVLLRVGRKPVLVQSGAERVPCLGTRHARLVVRVPVQKRRGGWYSRHAHAVADARAHRGAHAVARGSQSRHADADARCCRVHGDRPGRRRDDHRAQRSHKTDRGGRHGDGKEPGHRGDENHRHGRHRGDHAKRRHNPHLNRPDRDAGVDPQLPRLGGHDRVIERDSPPHTGDGRFRVRRERDFHRHRRDCAPHDEVGRPHRSVCFGTANSTHGPHPSAFKHRHRDQRRARRHERRHGRGRAELARYRSA